MTNVQNLFNPKLTARVLEQVWGRVGLQTMRGYLPLKNPYCLAQPEFQSLNQLLTDMPVIRADGSAGFLAMNQFRPASRHLPDHASLFADWAKAIMTKTTSATVQSQCAFDLAMAFRDYQYLKMGYLFESVRHGSTQAADYLPANIANPLVLLARVFGQHPWLEYASGYVLMNSVFGPEISADKVQLLRQWHGGPDEFYFQTVHSIIEWETPALFGAIAQLIQGVEQQDLAQIVPALEQGIQTSEIMLTRLKLMTQLSRPAYYAADVRPQIQGLVGNCGPGKLFSEQGVYYESSYFDESRPRWLSEIRGQTGAQSSIIPLLDNIVGITDFYAQGDNPLTKMLREFRAYRPQPHTALLALVEQEQQRLQIRAYLKQHAPLLLARWTGVVCQFREFHFYLAMAYIVKPGKAQPQAQSRAIGTGGSPTPKYLPQHVGESLSALKDALQAVPKTGLSNQERALFEYWSSYFQQTVTANNARAQTVADYLDNSKTEQDLDQTITATREKIIEDEALV